MKSKLKTKKRILLLLLICFLCSACNQNTEKTIDKTSEVLPNGKHLVVEKN